MLFQADKASPLSPACLLESTLQQFKRPPWFKALQRQEMLQAGGFAANRSYMGTVTVFSSPDQGTVPKLVQRLDLS